jgi:hypothetical protein
MGQSCTLCLLDGAQIDGTMVYFDDGIVALDNVSACMSFDTPLNCGTGLFPLAQIRWIKPERAVAPDPQ